MNFVNALQLGGAVKPYVSKCKTVCKASYDSLSAADRKYLDEMLSKTPELYAQFQKFAPIVLKQLKDLDSEQVLSMVQLATKFLKKRSTVATVRSLIAKYGDIVKDKRRMKAIGAYLRCVLSHMEDEHKMILLSMFEMLMAVVAIVSDKEVAAFARELALSVHKAVIKPAVSEVKRVNKPRKAKAVKSA